MNKNLLTMVCLLIATIVEVSGDALVRKAIYEYTGTYRIICGLASAVLLFTYGFTLNLAPQEFNKIAGLYIATLFIVWQVISYLTFGDTPTWSVVMGGSMIVIGGLLVTFATF